MSNEYMKQTWSIRRRVYMSQIPEWCAKGNCFTISPSRRNMFVYPKHISSFTIHTPNAAPQLVFPIVSLCAHFFFYFTLIRYLKKIAALTNRVSRLHIEFQLSTSSQRVIFEQRVRYVFTSIKYPIYSVARQLAV